MKYKNIIIVFLSFILAYGCREEISITTIKDNLSFITNRSFYDFQNADGRFVLTYDDFFDRQVGNAAVEGYGVFYNEDEEKINPGVLQINGKMMQASEKNLYMMVSGDGEEGNFNDRNSIEVNFTSNNESNYESFSQDNLSAPPRLNVYSNLGRNGTFNANNDLSISWSVDPNNLDNKVYLLIASAGNKTQFYEFNDDDGQAIISSNNFEDFIDGQYIAVRLARYYSHCFETEQTNCVITATQSKFSGKVIH